MEPHLQVRNLRKTYGDFVALNDVSFSAQTGEIVALLGPSGCGKTTLLNVIAGFLSPQSGAILVAGKDIAPVKPHKRNMAMVFQNYALFPHMTIAANVGFGLKMRSVAAAECGQRVREALELVQLGHLAERYPKELSGGQQQRVALARALVVRPAVLLLDEPLSNLDALLRKTMREEMRRILKAAGITTVVVTHDQEEALVTADQIVLMSAGRVEQVASPQDLYEHPSSVFGARFMDVTNLFEGTVEERTGATTLVRTAFGPIKVKDVEGSKSLRADDVVVAIRPGNISLGTCQKENRAVGRVVANSYHGAVNRIEIDASGTHIVADLPVRDVRAVPGDELTFSWAAEDTRLLPAGNAESHGSSGSVAASLS